MHYTTLREGRLRASRRLGAIRHLTGVLICLLMVSCSSSVRTPASGSAVATPIQTQGLEPPTATDPSIITQSDILMTPTATATVAVPTASPTPTIRPATPTALPTATVTPPVTETLWSYPVGVPGRPFGDGFVIRHVYAAENTWFSPGSWHTAEDWYLMEGDSTGARVYAASDGEVVFAGANYPGRVVIVQHAAGLYSMYGHLDPRLAVQEGQRVARGDVLGTIALGDERAAGHLHFEIRTFLTKPQINGSAPRYRYKCGVNCPPGPGYWPIRAPDHPTALGWRDPTPLINRRAFASLRDTNSALPLGEVVVATQPVSGSVTLWSSSPTGGMQPQALAQLQLTPGERFLLLDVETDAEATERRSARHFKLWYRVRDPDGREGWVQAAVPSSLETGSDGSPSSVVFNFFPAVIAR